MNRMTQIKNAVPRPETLLQIRRPRALDGAAVWRLINASGTLDANSLYCNLLQCSHFAATCAVAELDGEIVGWMSGYVPPETPNALFVWQICVADAARGRGLARRLVAEVLARPQTTALQYVECTITPTNQPSWALFRSIARALDTGLHTQPHFLRGAHLDGQHDSEIRVMIGPFANSPAALAKAA